VSGPTGTLNRVVAPFIPDPVQTSVLEHVSGTLVVDGGFGTGKTEVLRERFARLIEGGADAERVALVVGSRRARDEARAALLARIDAPLPSLNVVTIHGLAFHLVGQRSGALGYLEPPAVLSAADQFARVRELLAGEDPVSWPAYGALLGLRGFADEVRQFLTRSQESLLDAEAISTAARARGLGGWRELGSFLGTYLDVLDAANEVDFAGLLVRAASAAADGEPPFDHVLVDDAQDLTLAADAVIRAIRPTSLVVAGNLDAHVYSFQGTTDAPFRRSLDEGVVLELATAHRPAPEEVEAWHAPHVSEEHAAVARELRRIHVREGVAWRDLAVVVRRFDAHAGGLRRALEDAGVPFATDAAPAPGSVPATRPFVLALRWIVAPPEQRDALIEPLLTSELGRLSPAGARTFLRAVRAYRVERRDVLEHLDLLDDPDAAAPLAALRDVLAEATALRGSVLDAFRTMWHRLPGPADLVAKAPDDPQAAADLDVLVAFSRSVSDAASEGDGSVDAFLADLDAAEGAPELAHGATDADEVQLLTAHATSGRAFDTVIVTGATEGNFPSLSRPEPMFDLAALEGTRSRSELNRARLADERRLFSTVRHRARRRLLITATEAHGDADGVTLASRFVDELGVAWTPAPALADVEDPVSVGEAIATWRRAAAANDADAVERVASLEALLAIGDDPRRWWFQHDWTEGEIVDDGELRLSYSRLSTLENCELQYVLSTELGLDPVGGYQAWVGRLVHTIIEDCERGLVERSPGGFRRVLEERWDESRFPSFAISEAERANAHHVLVDNWFARYAELPATAVEQVFEFELDGALIRGKIDRIGPVPGGGTRITDYKTGRSDNAPKAADSLQLGIYYLAVNEVEALATHRPIEAVELAFLGGKKKDPTLDVREWTIEAGTEAEYQQRVRERVSDLIAQIRELDGSRRYVANAKASCFFCRFQTLCTRYPQGGAVFPLEAEPMPMPTLEPGAASASVESRRAVEVTPLGPGEQLELMP
jgi:superfamily I DNA/RNA helicase/CRISPR/Cas system-associated exonuclease Cas4 (RecB family)